MKLLDLMENTDRTWWLLESLPQHMILLEDRIEWMRKNLLPQLEKAEEERGGKKEDAKHWFTLSINSDPTRKKIYAQWIIRQQINNDVGSQLGGNLKLTLQNYEEFKKDPEFPQEFKDINQFSSIEELSKTVREFAERKSNQQEEFQQEINSETEFVDENQKWRVVIPRSDQAAAYWGRHSDWCTARGYPWCKQKDRTSMFNEYRDIGTLMVFIDQNTGEEAYQLFMADQHENDPDTEEFFELRDVENEYVDFAQLRGLLRGLPRATQRVMDFAQEMLREDVYTYVKEMALIVITDGKPHAPTEKMLKKQGNLVNLAVYSGLVYNAEWDWLRDILEKHKGDDNASQVAVRILLENGPPAAWRKDPQRIDQYFQKDRYMLITYITTAMEKGKPNPYIEKMVRERNSNLVTRNYEEVVTGRTQ